MKHITIYDGSSTSVMYLRESFHLLSTWLGYIYFINTDSIIKRYFSDQTKTPFLDTGRKIRKTLLLKKVPILISYFFLIPLLVVHTEFSKYWGFMSHHGGEEAGEKFLIPYSHPTSKIANLDGE